jgi:hypothetical protein
VLKEFKDFAVLSKVDALEIKNKVQAYQPWNNTINTNNPINTSTYKITTFSQTETIYFMNAGSGEIKPYLEITNKEIDKTLFDRSVIKEKIIDKEVFKFFMGTYYEDIKKFASDHELDFKNKEDVLQLFEHYEKLTNQN